MSALKLFISLCMFFGLPSLGAHHCEFRAERGTLTPIRGFSTNKSHAEGSRFSNIHLRTHFGTDAQLPQWDANIIVS